MVTTMCLVRNNLYNQHQHHYNTPTPFPSPVTREELRFIPRVLQVLQVLPVLHVVIWDGLQHSLVKFLHELPEDHGVHVLAQLVEYEPVSQPQPPADVLHLHPPHEPGALLQDAEPQSGHHQQGQSVDRLERRWRLVIIIEVFDL